jgi:hypothetical protein
VKPLLPYAGERYAYKRIKSDAAAARREFNIPFDWFVKMCHEPCHYCGRTDRNTISIKSRSVTGGFVVRDFKYNGLDRVENSGGYTVGNCVPCCAVCNRAKNSMGYNEFIKYINDLINFRTSGDDYHERDIRAVPLSVSGGRGEAGNEVKVTFAQGGYVSKDGTLFGAYEVDCYVPWELVRDKHARYSIDKQEEEPEQA